MTKYLGAALLLASLSAAGCGGGGVSVSGTVTYKGKPVNYGTVVLVDASGLPKSGAIGSDGTFSIAGVTPGSAKVAVSSPRPPGAAEKAAAKGGRERGEPDDKKPTEQPPADPALVAGWVAIPDAYGDPAKSDLVVTVEPGKPLAIELK